MTEAKIQNDDRCVFALGENNDGTTVLIVGLNAHTWEYIKDGKTSTIDLTKVGVPLQLILFGAETKEDCLKLFQQHKDFNEAFQGAKDFGIKTKPVN